MDNKKKEKESIPYAQMKDGSILTIWTNHWGLKVRPAVRIDKLKFSFVDKGTEGKGKTFDIYMDTLKDGMPCFENWLYDYRHGILSKVLADEKSAGEQYPKTYLYRTGDNAENSVGIANSSSGNGYVINASTTVNGKKLFVNIPVTYHDIRRLFERYEKIFAGRMEELEQILEDSVKESQKYFENASAQNKEPDQRPNVKENEKSASKEPEKPASKEPELVACLARTTKQLVEDGKKNLIMETVDEHERQMTFVLHPKYRERQMKTARKLFEEGCQRAGMMVKVEYFDFKGQHMAFNVAIVEE